jgi:catechol 2,3-dioxygenase-like lactoylglutathione lyase family enzyme
MSALARVATVVIDCAVPDRLADFYRVVTGAEVTHRDADFVSLAGDGTVQLAFQRVAGYRPPNWPDPAKHAHLDFQVADVDQAVKELLALGAAKPDFQPGGQDWVVLTDPEGHPFCLAAGE